MPMAPVSRATDRRRSVNSTRHRAMAKKSPAQPTFCGRSSSRGYSVVTPRSCGPFSRRARQSQVMCPTMVSPACRGQVADALAFAQGLAPAVQGQHGQPVSLAHPHVAGALADRVRARRDDHLGDARLGGGKASPKASNSSWTLQAEVPGELLAVSGGGHDADHASASNGTSRGQPLGRCAGSAYRASWPPREPGRRAPRRTAACPPVHCLRGPPSPSCSS